jgi:hypothetical protein
MARSLTRDITDYIGILTRINDVQFALKIQEKISDV